MTPVSTLSFKCALITGGGGGIGRAMAENLIALGKSVIIAGRTESNLKKTASEIGAKDHYVLDVSDIASMDGFVKNLLSKHPEVDCLINNAGGRISWSLLEWTHGLPTRTMW
jgi:NADP-dependent 3-hydroxy acid dehydrogenase YdfG